MSGAQDPDWREESKKNHNSGLQESRFWVVQGLGGKSLMGDCTGEKRVLRELIGVGFFGSVFVFFRGGRLDVVCFEGSPLPS